MLYGFKLQPFHRYGLDRKGEWISSGKCEFENGRATKIEVFRYRDGEWRKQMEEPQSDNCELLQMMFAAEQMKIEKAKSKSKE